MKNRKVLVANRGEIACRIIQSCKKQGISTVAVYSEADANSKHVELADESFLLGAPKAADSYLKVDKIISVANETQADAIHPGYGFLAENADFAQKLRDNGLIWIGPDPQTIIDMGDKERARTIAVESGVPVLPGSERFSDGDLKGLTEAAEKVGYPLLVKASAGGGGIGMQLVEDSEKLVKVAESTQSMAARSFGDGTIFLERYVPKARHVEMQIFGFGDGRVIHLFERDCSIQRRFQKIIEESPAPVLPVDVRDRIAEAAVSLASKQKYSGAGTVEFIVDAESFEFFFLEMNTRIQVEHPVTEMTTETDLVEMQLKLAFGEDLSDIKQSDIVQKGHAIECRIYAENPEKMFLPSPGKLNVFSIPSNGGEVRLDTGVREGDTITAYYDPMIAKLICYGENREQAIHNTLEVLKNSCIKGPASNLKFLQNALSHANFQQGDVYTGFIDQHKSNLI